MCGYVTVRSEGRPDGDFSVVVGVCAVPDDPTTISVATSVRSKADSASWANSDLIETGVEP